MRIRTDGSRRAVGGCARVDGPAVLCYAFSETEVEWQMNTYHTATVIT
ncbi:hypothetical protein [Pseudoramibacter alactolyticus]|nr:hypothetical protein [Pseudoramibacter alactolyticus]